MPIENPLPPPPLTRSREEFVLRVGPLLAHLQSVAIRYEGPGANAGDLVQDTLERAWCSFERWQSGTNLKAWLTTIMHNLFVDRYRRRRFEVAYHPRMLSEVPTPEPETTARWQEVDQARLSQAVAKLDPRARAVFELHFVQRQSYREISARLGVPPGTVGTRLMRAREKLRRSLVQAGAAAAP